MCSGQHKPIGYEGACIAYGREARPAAPKHVTHSTGSIKSSIEHELAARVAVASHPSPATQRRTAAHKELVCIV